MEGKWCGAPFSPFEEKLGVRHRVSQQAAARPPRLGLDNRRGLLVSRPLGREKSRAPPSPPPRSTHKPSETAARPPRKNSQPASPDVFRPQGGKRRSQSCTVCLPRLSYNTSQTAARPPRLGLASRRCRLVSRPLGREKSRAPWRRSARPLVLRTSPRRLLRGLLVRTPSRLRRLFSALRAEKGAPNRERQFFSPSHLSLQTQT